MITQLNFKSGRTFVVKCDGFIIRKSKNNDIVNEIELKGLKIPKSLVNTYLNSIESIERIK